MTRLTELHAFILAQPGRTPRQLACAGVVAGVDLPALLGELAAQGRVVLGAGNGVWPAWAEAVANG